MHPFWDSGWRSISSELNPQSYIIDCDHGSDYNLAIRYLNCDLPCDKLFSHVFYPEGSACFPPANRGEHRGLLTSLNTRPQSPCQFSLDMEANSGRIM